MFKILGLRIALIIYVESNKIYKNSHVIFNNGYTIWDTLTEILSLSVHQCTSTKIAKTS